MATLYIEEFSKSVTQGQGMSALPAAMQPAIATQVVTISGASAVSKPFNAATRLVRIHSDVVCSYLFGAGGASPVALTTSPRLAAGVSEYFGVPPGGSIAAIANS